jgi:N-terminal domain of anti-restriction factor ArdC/IrrE N-terminal-like domain
MQSYNHTNPRWGDLLHKAVTEPGVVSTAFSKFHNYSLGNQLLALLQCQGRGIKPGPIATYSRWKELARYVRKGEKALTLCMSISVKRTETVEKDGQQVEQDSCATWFVYKNHWFVLRQTDGREYRPEPIPGWDETEALYALEIRKATFTALDGNVQGYARKREVAINPVAEQPESTLFHELAHIVLGHAAEGSVNSDSKDRTPKDLRELEAECVGVAVLRIARVSWRG